MPEVTGLERVYGNLKQDASAAVKTDSTMVPTRARRRAWFRVV